MVGILTFINLVIDLYKMVIFVSVIASWLIAFGVVNQYNQIVSTVLQVTSALTEPLFRPIRRILPNLGGLDLSPLIVLFTLIAIQAQIRSLAF